VIGARKTLTGISLGFDSCSEWMSVTVGLEKWTFKSTLCPLSAAAHRRLSNSEPVRHAAFLDLQVHSGFRILAVRPGRTGRCGRHHYRCRAVHGKAEQGAHV